MAAWQVPLSIQGPKMDTATDAAKAQLGIQQLANATAIQRQVQQENAQKLEEQKRAVSADKALAGALQKATKQNPDGKYSIDYDTAGNELTSQGYGQEYLKFDTARRAQLKAAADAAKAQLDQQAEAGGQFASIVDSIPKFPVGTPLNPTESNPATTTGPDPAAIKQWQTGVQLAVKEALSKKLIDPEHAQFAMQLAANPTIEGDQQLRQLGLMGIKHADQMTDARNKLNDFFDHHLQEVQTAEKTTEGITKELQQFGSIAGSVDNQDDWTKQRSLLTPAAQARVPVNYSEANRKAARMGAVPTEKQPEFNIQTMTAENMAKMTPQDWQAQADAVAGGNKDLAGRTKTLVASAVARGDFKAAQAAIKDAADQAGRIEVAKTEGQNRQIIINQGFAPGADGGPSDLAKMVGDYKISMSQAMSRMPPQAKAGFASQVRAVNPDFQESNYDTYKKMEADATSGKMGDKSNALNAMMGHLSVLDQAADALNSSDVQALNKLANFFNVQTGSTPITTYKAIVHRLAPEITSAYVTGGGTSGERGVNESDFDPALGAKQIKANIGVSALLADSKIKALQDQYKRGTYGRGKQSLISDEAEQARQRLAKQSPVATSDYVRTAVGKDNHKIGQKSDGSWYDLQTGKKIQ